MTSDEIRNRFLRFFEKRGHTIIPSASLVPENDPSVLFTTAGMHPLVPFLLGETHPHGDKLANIQKCVRTGDIEEIGDNTHLTFFEMMGNWSLGDYFKKDAIEWSYELLTSKEEGFGLDPQRLYVTCFEGDQNAPRDEESASIWNEIFKRNNVAGERIYFMSAGKNWWSPGDNGPCGPDSEMFYDLSGKLTNGLNRDEYIKADKEQRIVEIWNDVFMEFMKKDGKVIGKLEHQNVDTGSGLERIATVLQGKSNVFDTDLFAPIMVHAERISSSQKSQRIIADHVRTSVFMIADGVTPSNTDRGYVLRRLLRRAIFNTKDKSLNRDDISTLTDEIVRKYRNVYTNLKNKTDTIKLIIGEENQKFSRTIDQGLKEFNKLSDKGISGKEAFVLFSSYGFPFEMTKELAKERGIKISEAEFYDEMKKHQDLSRTGAEQKFKGGLADTSEQSVRYHTATHLLHQALRETLGNHVFQKGSNITPERLRFDFSFNRKMTDEEKKRVEDMINEKISDALPVTYEDISFAEAEKKGAIGLFEEKYGDTVRIYKIGDFSLEFCGGPHAKGTNELGRFKIVKEEAVSQGVRRIKAVLE